MTTNEKSYIEVKRDSRDECRCPGCIFDRPDLQHVGQMPRQARICEQMNHAITSVLCDAAYFTAPSLGDWPRPMLDGRFGLVFPHDEGAMLAVLVGAIGILLQNASEHIPIDVIVLQLQAQRLQCEQSRSTRQKHHELFKTALARGARNGAEVFEEIQAAHGCEPGDSNDPATHTHRN